MAGLAILVSFLEWPQMLLAAMVPGTISPINVIPAHNNNSKNGSIKFGIASLLFLYIGVTED
jgi:hypothetical protein